MCSILRRLPAPSAKDAELVGFAAAISGVDDAAVEAVLEAAREQPATGAELAELGGGSN